MSPTVVLVTIVAVALIGCSASQNGEFVLSNERGIHVVGTAIARATPDVVLVEVGHAATAARASDVRSSVDEVMKRIIAAVKEKGLSGEDIQTVEYSLGATYDRAGRRTGWRMVNIIRLRIKAVDNPGDVIDDAVAAGATIVKNISYTVENVERLRRQARDEAIAVAKAKAEQMASALGVQIGAPISIVEGDPYYQSAYKFDAAAVAEAAPGASEAVVSAGQVVASLRVEVTFEIE